MKKLKAFPVFETDEDAERFVDEADLSEYDLSGFRPMEDVLPFLSEGLITVSLKVSPPMMEAIRTRADAEGVSYDMYIQRAILDALDRTPSLKK